MTRTVRLLLAAGVVLTAVGGLGLAAGANSSGSPRAPVDRALGPGRATVTIGIEHSRFSESRIVVHRGTQLTFVVENTDPIGHELIVGPPGVHARHETGTEAAHPPVPGEVTAPALQTVSTTYTFDELGEVTYACHLPGHLAYGMAGQVVVIE